MKIVSNEKLIRRNERIAKYTGLAGLAVLLVGVYLFFTNPENFALIWAIVLLGFIFSQVGIYFTNRWGRRPRPDEHLNQALKGLDNNYALYHYITPTPHLLVGPAGIWVLLPRYQRGKISYEKGRWRQRGGGVFLTYMKFFGQEGLGRPELEIASEIESVQNLLKKEMPDKEIPPVQAALVFTDERAELEADDAPHPTVYARRLKEVIRKAAKAKALSTDRSREIQAVLGGDGVETESGDVEPEKGSKKAKMEKRKAKGG